MGDAGGSQSSSARARPGTFRSRRLLSLAGDARLVAQIRRGNEAAFEVVFERHAPAILAFCRHMLGSRDEAEDAVQHTFAAAYRDLRRGGEREIELKPWLFTIARNRCRSLLRRRREVPVDEVRTVPVEGLEEQVERRSELRRLVADVRDLPDEQRAALLLAELGDLSHAEVAKVLGCEPSRVKALVFRARSRLIARRAARDTPCEEIRMQLATLRGGAARRTELRLHLLECQDCRAYREEVRRQRQMLAVALPVAPTAALKSSVLTAIGLGGSAGGAASVAGGLGGAMVAKVAVVSALAGGGMVAGEAVIRSDHPAPAPVQPAPENGRGRDATPAGSTAPSRGAPAVRGHDGLRPAGGPGASGIAGGAPGRERGEAKRGARARGRGPIEAPPGATPVRRGPADKAAKPHKSAKPDRAGKPDHPGGGDAKAPKGRPEKVSGPQKAAKPQTQARPDRSGATTEAWSGSTAKPGARHEPATRAGAPAASPAPLGDRNVALTPRGNSNKSKTAAALD